MQDPAEQGRGAVAGAESHQARWYLLALALLVTLLNGFKPITSDDNCYYFRAEKMAQHPLDPYGGESLVWESPPLLPAWLAVGMRVLGDGDYVLKCWLLPFALILVLSLDALLRRFAGGLQRPLLAMIVLGPLVLTSFALMLDIPALALLLAAVAIFLSAVERKSLGRALLAGLVAGLAMQTKYTGVTACGAILAYGILTRQGKLTGAALGLAASVFIAWEAAVQGRYGTSQFLQAWVWKAPGLPPPSSKGMMLLSLVTIAGCMAPGVIPLGLIARRLGPRILVAAMAAIVAIYAALVLVPNSWMDAMSEHLGLGRFGLHYLTVDWLGIPFWGIALGVLWRQYIRRWPTLDVAQRFLLLWLAVEILFYFPLSPFPAVRRLLGIVTVLILLLGQTVARQIAGQPDRRRWVYAAAALNVAVGLALFFVDLEERWAVKTAVRQADAVVQSHGRTGTVWYAGFAGQWYDAHRAGMTRLVPDRSCLRSGDWLVLFRDLIIYEAIDVDPQKVKRVAIMDGGDWLPLSTKLMGGKHPIQHRYAPQIVTTVYQVTADFVPQTAPSTPSNSPRRPSP
jgi:hypothetical protein